MEQQRQQRWEKTTETNGTQQQRKWSKKMEQQWASTTGK